jgi:hypothetical protein
MKFSKIIGPSDGEDAKKLIEDSATYLSAVFSELSARWDISIFGSALGGDPLLMQLVAPLPHYCDLTGYSYGKLSPGCEKANRKTSIALPLNEEDLTAVIKAKEFKAKYRQILTTAATDGKAYYWAPDFVLSKSKVGVRLLINHEGQHAALSHPNRRGYRIPELWNIAIDFKANFNTFEDLRARKIRNPEVVFKELGDFITLDEYCAFVKDPYHPPEKLIKAGPVFGIQKMLEPNYIENAEDVPFLLYAEPNLTGDLLQPEVIYEHILNLVPHCKECGKKFCYKKSEEYKELELKLEKLIQENVKTYETKKEMSM